MSKLFIRALCLFLIIISCKNTQDNNAKEAVTINQEITEKDISKIDYTEFLLDEKTEKYTIEWAEYNQLQIIIDNLKNADLSFFKDNKEAVNTTLTELKKNIPEPLNTSAIIARINAFETKFLKLQSISNLTTSSKQDLLKNIKELLVAFSNLNLQMNKKVEFDHQVIPKP